MDVTFSHYESNVSNSYPETSENMALYIFRNRLGHYRCDVLCGRTDWSSCTVIRVWRKQIPLFTDSLFVSDQIYCCPVETRNISMCLARGLDSENHTIQK